MATQEQLENWRGIAGSVPLAVEMWQTLSYSERAVVWENWRRIRATAKMDACRDLSGLTPQLNGLEGWRVAVVRKNGETCRFIVGKSAGWKPCHLEIRTTRSMGGIPADDNYREIRKIEHVKYRRYGGADTRN